MDKELTLDGRGAPALDHQHSAQPGHDYQAVINRKAYPFKNHNEDGRQLLVAADFIPADECVLIRSLPHGSQSIGLDETVDLRDSAANVFWAFKSDRMFRYTLEERGYEWGDGKIIEPMIRELGQVPDDRVIYLDREDEPDKLLGPDDVVDLAHAGTEHLHTESRFITVFYNDDPVKIARGSYTTEKLKEFFGIKEGCVLNVVDEHGQSRALKDGERTTVKEDEHFFSQVPCGGTS